VPQERADEALAVAIRVRAMIRGLLKGRGAA
jgi:hypothetical protein